MRSTKALFMLVQPLIEARVCKPSCSENAFRQRNHGLDSYVKRPLLPMNVLML